MAKFDLVGQESLVTYPGSHLGLELCPSRLFVHGEDVVLVLHRLSWTIPLGLDKLGAGSAGETNGVGVRIHDLVRAHTDQLAVLLLRLVVLFEPCATCSHLDKGNLGD